MQLPKGGSVLFPGRILVEGVHPAVLARLGDGPCDHCGCRDVYMVGQLQVAQDDGPPAHRAMGADACTASHPHATRHGGVGADANVVADLDEVVELDAVFDDGVFQRATVHTGVGPDLDIVADVSRAIDDLIESSGVLGNADWTLGVTSPGIDRPLTQPRHWRRNVGRMVQVQLADGRDALGRIMEYDEATGALLLQVKGANRKFNTADIVKAIVQVEFNRKIADSELDVIDDGSDPDVVDAEEDFSESDEEA